LIQRIRRIHSRTDFDLKHTKSSGRKLQYFDAELNQNYALRCGNVCWIRQNVLGSFATSLKEETLEDGSTRTVLNYLL
jgi:glycyl-tRNA synthetase